MLLDINYCMNQDSEGSGSTGMAFLICCSEVRNGKLILHEAIQPCFHDPCRVVRFSINSTTFKHVCEFIFARHSSLFETCHNSFMHGVQFTSAGFRLRLLY